VAKPGHAYSRTAGSVSEHTGMICMRAPDAASRTHTLRSAPPQATSRPSGDTASAKMLPECGAMQRTGTRRSTSHT
jgi:hypothetical protein